LFPDFHDQTTLAAGAAEHVNRTVTPRRRPNRDLRTREHLTPKEVDRLIEGTKGNRWSHRDATMILLAYRHGLRASELVDLRWEQVDLSHAVLHVRRVKAGTPSTHPLTGRELRALRRLQREAPTSPFVFVSERGALLMVPSGHGCGRNAAPSALTNHDPPPRPFLET
jgi:integrase